MNLTQKRQFLGTRVACAAGAVLVALGGILLNIVSDPLRSAPAFLVGVVATTVGVVFVLVGISAVRVKAPSPTLLKRGIEAVVVAALVFVGAGLAMQLLYVDQNAYKYLVVAAVPLLVVLAAAYLGINALAGRLNK